eukprot:TRINITY_DN15634_c1_g1_i1.p1 TRINITY_DN15634_c1_g1~~TRINITY_DN15634_c1_g1_i1.p1  ORF type:complete len:147 (+),score=18.37 TRINITY_DN15634_c1_g1_i1:43-483(+)
MGNLFGCLPEEDTLGEMVDPVVWEMERKAAEAAKREDFEESLACLEQAGVETGYILNARGVIYCSQGRFTESIADFTSAIHLSPHSGLYYYNRGQVKLKCSTRQDAANDFRKALEVDPTLTKGRPSYTKTRWLIKPTTWHYSLPVF